MFQAIVAFLIVIIVLTVVHEYGHFWVARLFGVKVLRFSIGLGKILFSWHDKLGTEYVVSMLPLGGYTKMLDGTEGKVARSEQPMAFDKKPLKIRTAIVLAGPLANLLFAVFLFWLSFLIGTPTIAPVLGNVPKGSAAELAGLVQGQEIIAVNDAQVRGWEEIAMVLLEGVGKSTAFTLTVQNQKDNKITHHRLNLSLLLAGEKTHLLKSLGIEPFDPIPPIVGSLMKGLPAQMSGLQVGDKILAINEQLVSTRTELTQAIRLYAGQSIALKVQRQEEVFRINLVPVRKLLEGGEEVGFIGLKYKIQPYPKNLIRVNRYTPVQAMVHAFGKTKAYTLLTLTVLRKMLTGDISFQYVAGPISIAKYAGDTFKIGLTSFLGFMGFVSISFGVLNLLPIPVLDGGHLVYYLYEAIVGRKPSERMLALATKIGVLILVCLMTIAFYNDLSRL